MTNTTTPVESIGAPSGAASFYRWEVPDKPVSILLSLDLIDRLERDVIESFKAVTKRGSEIGGVLGGRVVGGRRPTVIVESFEPVECDYSRGPLYLLSDEDKVKLRQALDRVKNAGGGTTVAGFFRSNTRRELVLDEEDHALAQEFFADPDNIFLLVRPFAMKPSAGGFFFWENGQVQSESYLQFPFKRAELVKSFAQFIVAAPEAPAPEAPPVREPLMMPKREERPVAPPVLKREEPKPAVAAPPRREEPAPPPPAALRREEPKREEPVIPPTFKREEPRTPVAQPPRREDAPHLNFRRDNRPPVVRREEPAPPKQEERPPVMLKREERVAPPVMLKREERQPIAPVTPKREERPAPVSRREEPAPVPAPPAPPVAAAPPKKDERPAPPMVSRREERPTVVVKREEKPAPPPVVVKPEEPAPAKPEEKPVVAKAPEVVVVAPTKKEEPVKVEPVRVEPRKPEPVAAPVAAATSFERMPMAAAPVEAPGRSSNLKWVIVALVVILAAGAGYYFLRVKGAPAAVATKVADTSLGLKVETNAGQLLLSWNRNAPLIATATRATLSIMDGDHKEDVDLDLGSLRSGSIVYSPMTSDVSFRLEVADAKNGGSQAETVRRLVGRPSPTVAATNPTTQPQPAPAKANTPERAAAAPSPVTPTRTAATPPPAPQVAASTAVTAAPPRENTLAARLSAPEPQQIPAPPSIDTSSNALSGRAPGAPLTAAPAPAPAQPAAQAPRQNSSASQQSAPLKVGGVTQEARVIKRVPASYPALARQMRITGIVRVHATVGKNGRIKKANAISGHSMLRQAAVDAVMKWLYSPAILDGEPVESDTQVDVTFTM